jgi:hypothetical protein
LATERKERERERERSETTCQVERVLAKKLSSSNPISFKVSPNQTKAFLLPTPKSRVGRRAAFEIKARPRNPPVKP